METHEMFENAISAVSIYNQKIIRIFSAALHVIYRSVAINYIHAKITTMHTKSNV